VVVGQKGLTTAVERQWEKMTVCGRWRQLGLEVSGGEGVDVVELWTRAALLEVVVRPEVLGW
jgi:hypothetical protein